MNKPTGGTFTLHVDGQTFGPFPVRVEVLWNCRTPSDDVLRDRWLPAVILGTSGERWHVRTDCGKETRDCAPECVRPIQSRPLAGVLCSFCGADMILSEGWVPSYNDPDNSVGAKESEPICVICEGRKK